MEWGRSHYGDVLMQYRFTTRFGGVSQAPYESLNLAFHVGDNPECVKKNRELLQEELGISKLVFMEQVHGDGVSLTVNDVSKKDVRLTIIPHTLEKH